MSERELRPLFLDELEPVMEQQRQAWSALAPVDGFRRAWLQLLRTRWARGHVQIWGYFREGRLAGAFRLHRLEVLINGHKRTCAGLGSVVVMPERRGRGAVQEMLQMACDHLRSQFSVCILFATTGPRFYRDLGFFPLPNLKYVLVRNLPREERAVEARGGRNGRLLRRQASMRVDERVQAEVRLYECADLPDLVQIYNLDVSLRKLGILRTESYWEHLFERERIMQALTSGPEQALRTYVCRSDDHTAGYVTLRWGRDRMQVLESPAESFRYQNWMLRWAVTLSATENVPRVESQVPLRSGEGDVRILVRRDSPLMMLHPLGSGLGAEDFPYPAENFLWSRDRF